MAACAFSVELTELAPGAALTLVDICFAIPPRSIDPASGFILGIDLAISCTALAIPSVFAPIINFCA